MDTLLPTTMVGSWPRPSWFRYQLEGRDVLEAFKVIHHAEAFHDATRCCIKDQEDVGLDILTDGLFAAPAYKTYGKIIADKAWLGEAGFTATTGLKDINLALAAGEAAGVPTPSVGVSRDRLISAIAKGLGDRDWTVMALEQARASGLED